MKKNRAQKDILYISISSFILVVLWIGFNIYHAHVTSTIEPDLQFQITPIDPKFDTDTISKLKSRKKIIPLYENPNASSSSSASPAPEITEIPAASKSSQLLIPINPAENLGQ